MIILSWNCRGLGAARTIRELIALIRFHRPGIVFLMETRIGRLKVESVRIRLGFDYALGVERNGLGGGLMILWRREVDLNIKSYSRNHIDAVVEGDCRWRFTGFYGFPDLPMRKKGWRLMTLLNTMMDLPWVLMGDFNEVMKMEEVAGRRKRCKWQIDDFRSAVGECGLKNIRFKGTKFTFSNRRMGEEETKARLDRALAREDWNQLWPRAEVLHIHALNSDHCPIILNMSGLEEARPRRKRVGQRSFKFEPMWTRHADFKGIVNEVWDKSVGEGKQLHEILEDCQKQLTHWNLKEFGNVQA